MGFITQERVNSCANTGHSAPVLLRLLGHFCLDRLGTVWPGAPVSRGKTGSDEEIGNVARV